ncbi:hypothetical protein ACJX0J_020085 [Zea mays]
MKHAKNANSILLSSHLMYYFVFLTCCTKTIEPEPEATVFCQLNMIWFILWDAYGYLKCCLYHGHRLLEEDELITLVASFLWTRLFGKGRHNFTLLHPYAYSFAVAKQKKENTTLPSTCIIVWMYRSKGKIQDLFLFVRSHIFSTSLIVISRSSRGNIHILDEDEAQFSCGD